MASENTTSNHGPLLIDPRTRYEDLKLELPTGQGYPVLQRDFPTQPDSGEHTYKGRGRLHNRRALITGGDSGIGRATVIAMAREGAKVAINYLPEEEPDAEYVAHLLAKEGIEITRIPGNLLDEEFCAELVKKAEKALGGIDILVNNAGRGGAFNADISTYTTEQWDTIFRTNVYAGFFITRAAVPCMPPGSTIVWTVSDVVANPVNGIHDYAATKGAVNSLVQTLAISLASKGIRINGVAPGLTYTPILAGLGMTTEQLNQFVATLPLRRPAQPAELAPLYVDLADAQKSYTSGALLSATGGTTAYILG